MELGEDQREAFKQIESTDGPWFITGEAGTGKSALLRYLRDKGRDAASTVVLAFTGAAAVNVGGMTVHSFALKSSAYGKKLSVYVPLGKTHDELRIKNFEDIAKANVIIIDEISMLRADLVDALDRALRLAKGLPDKPFGGVRLVLFGDLYQLPPFIVDYELLTRERYFLESYQSYKSESSAPYFFEAHAFTFEKINFFNLHINKRQSENDFAEALNALRGDELSPAARSFFRKLETTSVPANSTVLFAHRKPARIFNERKLAVLPGKEYTYDAESWNASELGRGIDSKPYLDILTLKVGCLVMVTKNIDFDAKIVNGAIGTVQKCEIDSVDVLIHETGETYTVPRVSFDVLGFAPDDGSSRTEGFAEDSRQKARLIKTKIVGYVRQIPLIPAYGLTIHKAQGQTLTNVTVDLREDLQVPGQAYVALSRATHKDGLYTLGALSHGHIVPYPNRLKEFLQAPKYLTPKLEDENGHVVDYVLEQIRETLFWRGSGWLESALNDSLRGIGSVQDFRHVHHRRKMIYLQEHNANRPYDYFIHLAGTEPLVAFSIAINVDKSVRGRPQIFAPDLDPSGWPFKIPYFRSISHLKDEANPAKQDRNLHCYALPEPDSINWTAFGHEEIEISKSQAGQWRFKRGIKRFVSEQNAQSSKIDHYFDSSLLNFIEHHRLSFWDDTVTSLTVQNWAGDDEQLDFLLRRLFVRRPEPSKIAFVSNKSDLSG